MNEQNPSPSGPPVDETKHSTTVHARNGARAMLTRGGADGLNFLTVSHQGVTLTAILSDDNLRALLVPRAQCCAVCKHARSPLGATRCFERERTRGGHVYAPIIDRPREHVCGKFAQLVRPVPREVAA